MISPTDTVQTQVKPSLPTPALYDSKVLLVPRTKSVKLVFFIINAERVSSDAFRDHAVNRQDRVSFEIVCFM